MGDSFIYIHVIFLFLCFNVLVKSDVNLECGDNEVVDTCPGACNDFCPVSEDDNECFITSPDPESCGAPACRCGFNSKRDIDTGICIPVRDCPPFDCSARPNEEYVSCPPLCSDKCSQVTPSGGCHFIGNIGIVVECKPTCRCMPGFGRKDGLCVPLNECPGAESQQCKENEEFSTCIQSLCRGDSCSQLDKQIECPLVQAEKCQGGCVCIAGNLRNENGVCVPEDQCPVICRENEEFSNCTQAICRCQNCADLGRVIDCPFISAGFKCEEGCMCIEGTLRDKNGNCIPSDECPEEPECGANEIFNECGNACDNDACHTCIDYEYIDDCIATAVCQPQCQCAPGFNRDEYGNCIPQDQCPKEPECGVNEIFNECGNACDNDACPASIENEYIDDCIALAVCLPQCQCAPGFNRDANGNCIPQDQCPSLSCGANEMLNQCPSTCNDDSCPIDLSEEDSEDVFCAAVCGAPRCECIDNFKRDQNGNCIPQDQCPRLSCSANETLNQCPSICFNDSCPMVSSIEGSDEILCPAVCGPPRCECIDHFKREPNGNCIPQDQCPDISSEPCSANETLNQCPSICNNDSCPMDLSNEDSEEACAAVCGPPRCECIDNFKRDETGNCIPQDQCPGSSCGANEILSECSSICNRDLEACPTDSDEDSEEIFCAEVCSPPKCVCMANFKRDQNGNCVPEDQCPGSSCDENEMFNQCPSKCETDACPTSSSYEDYAEECVAVCGTPRCECIDNFKRDQNGKCVPEDQCPGLSCGLNEMVNQCPSTCITDACPTNSSTEDAQLFCPAVCGPPRCECINKFKRDQNGNCLPQAQCSAEISCSANEILNQCPNVCNNDACPTPESSDESSEEQFCITVCGPPKCECVDGFKRNQNGDCVPQDQCPVQICGPNEKFNDCPSVCKNDSCPANLTADGDVPCIKVCGTPRCECTDNFKRADDGNCIPIQDCPGICPTNEEYSSCPQNVCRSQDCSQFGEDISCTDIGDEPCEEGCVCIPGTVRDDNGSCIPQDQCLNQTQPLQCLAPNEISSCVQSCPPERTCDNRDIQFNCLQQANSRCENKCICKPGFFKNAIGECISKNECEQCSGENEFFSCGQECDNVCGDLDQNRTNCRIINIMCNRKCYCKDGFARDGRGKCVPLEQCPKTETKCADPNEEFRSCKVTCPPDSCFSIVARFKCVENPPCNPGCNCKSGFLRINETSSCIPYCKCPELKNTDVEC